MKHWLIAATLVVSSTTAAEAAQVIDQSALVAPAQAYRLSSAGVIARPTGNIINVLVQTVTAGVTGRLDAIDLQLRRSASGFVNFNLFDGDGAVFGANSLYTISIDLATIPGGPVNPDALTTVDVSAANLQLTPGKLFSFGLFPANPLNEPGAVAILTGSGPEGNGPPPPNVYGGGTLKVSPNFSTYFPLDGDAGFRTRVSVLAAPEPANWCLMVVGFGAIGMTMRARRLRTRTSTG